MPKSVHMHVKNFTCIASTMHVKFEVHMHDRIVSHVWKDFTWNKMHGKKVHTYDKNFSHVLQSFTRMWNADVVNLYFCQHWFHMVPFFHTLFTPFSHDFHTHSPSSVCQEQQGCVGVLHMAIAFIQEQCYLIQINQPCPISLSDWIIDVSKQKSHPHLCLVIVELKIFFAFLDIRFWHVTWRAALMHISMLF